MASVTFTFDQAITAFGADFRGLNNDNFGPRTYLKAGDTEFEPPQMVEDQSVFYGFISDVPFTTLVFSGVMYKTTLDRFGVDNITFSDKIPNRDVSSVPLPPSALLFLPGCFGLAFFKQRKPV